MKYFDTENKEKLSEQLQGIRENRFALATAAERTRGKNAKETLRFLLDWKGYEKTLEIVAEAVNAASRCQPNISINSFLWAADIQSAAAAEDLHKYDFWSVQQIHPSKLNLMASYLRCYSTLWRK